MTYPTIPSNFGDRTSAYVWLVRSQRSSFAVLMSLTGGFGFGALSLLLGEGSNQDSFLAVLSTICFVILAQAALVSTVVSVVAKARAERFEVLRGYTTLFDSHVDVDQRDPFSGAVVRSSGEPYLSREHKRAVLKSR